MSNIQDASLSVLEPAQEEGKTHDDKGDVGGRQDDLCPGPRRQRSQFV